MTEISHEALRQELERREKVAEAGGGAARIERQHASGKLTARERLDLLFDPGSFCEMDAFVTHRCTDFGLEENKPLGDGVVTGYGRIDGRVGYIAGSRFDRPRRRLFFGCARLIVRGVVR